jgi:hypothetical protein
MVTQAGRFNREPCYRRRNQGNVIPSKRSCSESLLLAFGWQSGLLSFQRELFNKSSQNTNSAQEQA